MFAEVGLGKDLKVGSFGWFYIMVCDFLVQKVEIC